MTDLLAGKTILITGASAGIGAHAAHLFAQEGANLILTARRLPELEQVEAKIRDAGGDVLAVRADTTLAAESPESHRHRYRTVGPPGWRPE